MAMVGADAEQLEALAKLFSSRSKTLMQVYTDTRKRTQSSPWQGIDADGFRAEWDGSIRDQMTKASTALDDAAKVLVRQAEEQRKASRADGGKVGATGPGGGKDDPDGKGKPPDNDLLDLLKKILSAAGFTDDQIKLLIKALDGLPADKAWEIAKFLEKNGKVLNAIEKLGKLADPITLLIDFAKDFAHHGEYPTDERIVHALVAAAAPFLVGKALEEGSRILGGAIGGAITGPAAPIGGTVGSMVGLAIGHVLSDVTTSAMESSGATEAIADKVTDLYRDDVKPAMGKIGDIAGTVANGASDAAHAVGDAASDFGHGAVDKAGDAAGYIGGMFH